MGYQASIHWLTSKHQQKSRFRIYICASGKIKKPKLPAPLFGLFIRIFYKLSPDDRMLFSLKKIMEQLEDPRVIYNDTKVEHSRHFKQPAGNKFHPLNVARVLVIKTKAPLYVYR